ncbi:elongator complex protein 6 [Pectinophora gossypiella]|uniref:elongator complex protein 6 n=1 Tax=Pectinophora gossypiella TaxID=13191 RepID=UPI00214E3610|nr:elongator complex protein 6 [Pectinophora gossypiella]XP_049869276.1 elongator complex protein 6 [Pectinophora gossypiella]XP_049869277.1 elongator complex protein 6 [Pectinophora gossypiella]XP_049869278.1 elongator complex protein 6 [Pectinophora gossypiella]
MSSDIISSLQLDKDFGGSRVIVAQEINGCDSSFIVSCTLGHCIKNKKPVLIMSTHNSITHYQNVGLKMNYNIQRHIDNGLIQTYNLSGENVNMLMSNENVSLKVVLNEIKKIVSSMKEKHGSVNIIIDGVSHLFDLQYTLKEVNEFCKHLIAIIRGCENSFLLCLCNVASEDDVTHVMANLLSHKAHTVLEIESLSSGWSADVSGHLSIRHPGQKFQDEHTFTMDLKPAHYLFKLFDRGVKLFAPGTV